MGERRKRLWKVEVEKTVRLDLLVVADSEEEARRIAEENADDAEDSFDYADWWASEPHPVKSLDEIDQYDRDEHPWGDSEGKTCKEWLAEDDGLVRHAVPGCGGMWRMDGKTFVSCDGCGASAPATLSNLDAAWAQNDTTLAPATP